MKETKAARTVLLAVLMTFGAIRDGLVIVGGWVPELVSCVAHRFGKIATQKPFFKEGSTSGVILREVDLTLAFMCSTIV